MNRPQHPWRCSAHSRRQQARAVHVNWLTGQSRLHGCWPGRFCKSSELRFTSVILQASLDNLRLFASLIAYNYLCNTAVTASRCRGRYTVLALSADSESRHRSSRLARRQPLLRLMSFKPRSCSFIDDREAFAESRASTRNQLNDQRRSPQNTRSDAIPSPCAYVRFAVVLSTFLSRTRDIAHFRVVQRQELRSLKIVPLSPISGRYRSVNEMLATNA